MNKSRLFGAVCAASIGFITMSATAELIPKLGNRVVYDVDRDITWMADANLAEIEKFSLSIGVSLGVHPNDTSGIQGIINADGSMNWPGALFWIDAMNDANYLGFNDWRLPYTQQPDPSCSDQLDVSDWGYPTQGHGTTCLGSDMGHLYWVEGITAATPGPFLNVRTNDAPPYGYMSGTEYAPRPSYAWGAQFFSGYVGVAIKDADLLAWAVRDGDVASTILIDIKPNKKTENVIDLKKDKSLKVAIVGSTDFDALQVDPATVMFGPNQQSPKRYKGQDYNRDGFSDLVLTFQPNETGIACGDTEATLTGETYGGEAAVEGSDTFTVKPCP